MKTGTIFLLVVFITLGMEMVCSQRFFRGESAEGVLPEGGEGSELSFTPGGGLSQKQAVCQLQSGILALIRLISFDLLEQLPCIPILLITSG